MDMEVEDEMEMLRFEKDRSRKWKMEMENGRWKMEDLKIAGNALLLSIHSMALDVGNYAKVNGR